jgi:hypothetical protein
MIFLEVCKKYDICRHSDYAIIKRVMVCLTPLSSIFHLYLEKTIYRHDDSISEDVIKGVNHGHDDSIRSVNLGMSLLCSVVEMKL